MYCRHTIFVYHHWRVLSHRVKSIKCKGMLLCHSVVALLKCRGPKLQDAGDTNSPTKSRLNFSNPRPQINKGQRKTKSEIHKDQQQKNIQKTHQRTLERHHYICMQWRKLEQTKCRLTGQTVENNQEKNRKVKQKWDTTKTETRKHWSPMAQIGKQWGN